MNKQDLLELGLLRALDDTRLEPGDIYAEEVSADSAFEGTTHIGHDVCIQDAHLGASCRIGDDVTIDTGTHIGHAVTIHSDTEIHNDVVIGEHSTIGRAATLCYGVIVGPDVEIPDRAQIGEGMVIPSTHSIAVFGPLGIHNRIMTIHGSDNGPCYSSGCQHSISEAAMEERISRATATRESSTEHYKRFWPLLKAVGAEVQREYDTRRDEVARLIARAAIIHSSTPEAE